MKQKVSLNKHHTSGSIRNLIVTTSVRILAIVQERFDKNTRTICMTGKTSGLQKYEVFSDLFCEIKSNFTGFRGKQRFAHICVVPSG